MRFGRTAVLATAFVLLAAAGQDAGNQMLSNADLAALVSNGTFYQASSVSTPIPSNGMMVTASQFRSYILNSGTPGYKDNQLIAYTDALADASTPAPTPTPVPTKTASGSTPAPTAAPTTRPTAAPTSVPTHGGGGKQPINQ